LDYKKKGTTEIFPYTIDSSKKNKSLDQQTIKPQIGAFHMAPQRCSETAHYLVAKVSSAPYQTIPKIL
jgi:hypothetical protein